MDTTSYVALSRQISLQRHLATVANNIANATTTGYRAEHTLFEPVLERAGPPRRVAFVQDVGLYQDLSPGPITQTGNPLDLAINGEGYLTFATASGDRYARAGHLELDATGQIVNDHGDALLDESGAPVVLPDDAHEVSIGEDGTISAETGPVARLQLVTFGNEQALQRDGNGLYRADAVPRPAVGRLVQGALEESNVAPVLEMTTMLSTVRAFEGVQKLIDAQNEIERQAIERMISVTS